MSMTEKQITVIFKALCDENRVKIIRLLKNGERCACKLLDELQFTQPTLSHHMKILCDSGLVVGRKDGKWMYYSLSEQGIKNAVDCFSDLTSATPNQSNNS